jgi:hypothetical protein
VTLAWSHFPGNPSQPGDLVTLSTPAYVALVEGSAFDAILSTLSRADDLNLAWTSDTAPAVSDEVVFSVSAVSTQVYCTFGAATGAGVVPAAALGQLETGEASYNVHSKQFARESLTAANGAPWTLSFNIDATARTSYGLANGYVTLQ